MSTFATTVGSDRQSSISDHHVVNDDGNLMVLKTYAPITGSSSAEELMLLAAENSSSNDSSLRRCKTSVDLGLATLDPTKPISVVAEAAPDPASHRLTARALRRHDVACARAMDRRRNPFALHADGAFDPWRAEVPPRRQAAPNCAFLWFLRNNR